MNTEEPVRTAQMDKEQIRKQLEDLQREHAKTKRKLERSNKAAGIKAHVKQKLREQAKHENFDVSPARKDKDRSGADAIFKTCSRSVSFKLEQLDPRTTTVNDEPETVVEDKSDICPSTMTPDQVQCELDVNKNSNFFNSLAELDGCCIEKQAALEQGSCGVAETPVVKDNNDKGDIGVETPSLRGDASDGVPSEVSLGVSCVPDSGSQKGRGTDVGDGSEQHAVKVIEFEHNLSTVHINNVDIEKRSHLQADVMDWDDDISDDQLLLQRTEKLSNDVASEKANNQSVGFQEVQSHVSSHMVENSSSTVLCHSAGKVNESCNERKSAQFTFPSNTNNPCVSKLSSEKTVGKDVNHSMSVCTDVSESLLKTDSHLWDDGICDDQLAFIKGTHQGDDENQTLKSTVMSSAFQGNPAWGNIKVEMQIDGCTSNPDQIVLVEPSGMKQLMSDSEQVCENAPSSQAGHECWDDEVSDDVLLSHKESVSEMDQACDGRAKTLGGTAVSDQMSKDHSVAQGDVKSVDSSSICSVARKQIENCPSNSVEGKGTVNDTTADTSPEWTQMDFGNDTLDNLELDDDDSDKRVLLSDLSWCKTVQVTKIPTQPVLCVLCSTVLWQGDQCEVVVGCTRAGVKVWYYGRSDSDAWCERAAQAWMCRKNEFLVDVKILSDCHTPCLTLVLYGEFSLSPVNLLVFRDKVHLVPVFGHSSGGRHLTCVVNPWSVLVATVTPNSTQLYRHVVRQDYTCFDDTSHLQGAPDGLLGMSTVKHLKLALVGVSRQSVHIWNWELGVLLTSIPQLSSDIVSMANCGGAVHENGLFFLLLNTPSVIKLLVVNPNTGNSVLLHEFAVSQDRISNSVQHQNYVATVTQKGFVAIWDLTRQNLVAENRCKSFTAVSWHPKKPVLLCGTRDGAVHVHAKVNKSCTI